MRLAGQAQLGFYPTPLHLAQRLARAFTAPSDHGPSVAFDPFCGTGEALAVFPATHHVGNELDEGRAAEAATRLSTVHIGDAWSLAPQKRTVGLLLLNPPYDDDPVTGHRQELEALAQFVPWVHPQGWIVFIVPWRLWQKHFPHIVQMLTVTHVWRFPDPDYDAFNQCMIVGHPHNPHHLAQTPNDLPDTWFTKTHRAPLPKEHPITQSFGTDSVLDVWGSWSRREPLPLPERVDPIGRLPWTSPMTRLAHLAPRPEHLVEAIRATTTIWNSVRSLSQPRLPLSLDQPITTPITLHRGHLATLLTAGRLTGAIGTGPARHLVKGRVVPYTVVTQDETTDTESIHVTETRYRIELRTLHPDGQLKVWHHHDASTLIDDEDAAFDETVEADTASS